MSSATSGKLTLLSPLTPPSLTRAWLTVPHPTLPIAATCSEDKTVRIYSLTSFRLLSSIIGGHKRSVRSCAWQPGVKSASVLATGSFDSSVGVWKHQDDSHEDEGLGFNTASETGLEAEEDEEWRFALVLDGHDSEVKSVAWSAAGNFLATCSRDKSVWIWEEVAAEDFETIAVLQEHTGDVKCVSWHPEEELLASASYDDEVRLWKEDGDDWGCVAILAGHEGTVWAVEWEGLEVRLGGDDSMNEEREEWIKRRKLAGPRLMTCSDDLNIKVWRRRPKERQLQSQYSIIRSGNNEEDWIEEARLPKVHERSVYSVAWSRKTGLVVSAGGDGKIVVYAERWKVETNGITNTVPKPADLHPIPSSSLNDRVASTEWIVVAEFEGGHSVFEINHVSWAKRADRNKRSEEEEVILSTGDDGIANVWILDT